MRRRDFIGALTATAAFPFTARAQSSMPELGFLGSGSTNAQPEQIAMFFRGLSDGGFVEGRNIGIHYRWADDQYERLPSLARELVELRVSIIAATGGPVTALAAKEATQAIPIVFTAVSDPVRYGLVASMNRPGGNVTGTGGLVDELDAKRLELLSEIAPNARKIGVLFNANRPGVQAQIDNLLGTVRSSGQELVILRAGSAVEITTMFSGAAPDGIEGLLVTADPLFNNLRELVVETLAGLRIPTVFQRREFAAGGGLLSYGSSFAEAYQQAGGYVARILKGERPADLPILQPTKFDLVINLRTAKSLGLTIPATLLVRADEIIE